MGTLFQISEFRSVVDLPCLVSLVQRLGWEPCAGDGYWFVYLEILIGGIAYEKDVCFAGEI